jgi:hypothetical protein
MQKPFNLSTVINLKQFKISRAARQKLEQHGFVIVPALNEQPFFIYEQNAYARVPHFVTLDSVMHLYHLFFQFALRRLETKALAPLVAQLTRRLLAECKEMYRQAPASLRGAALRNIAYVGVAAELMGLKESIPEPAHPMVRKELELIQATAGLEVGAILPYAIDYSQFIVRGHYTRTPLLRRYFRTVMWFGLFPFSPRRLVPVNGTELTPEPLRQALLLTYALYRANLVDTWQKIMTPIDFLVGLADDLTPPEVKQIMDAVYGKSPRLIDLADATRFDQFTQRFLSARMPQIRPKFVSVGGTLPPLPDPDSPWMRLLGQRYVPDSEILQELSDPISRPVPQGLDVMAVLGSERAVQHLDSKPSPWAEYRSVRQKLTERFARLSKQEWTRNVYLAWLHVLKAVLQPLPQEAPPVLRTPHWQDKCLQTALASWAQLRHDTILYAKQSFVAAEGGDFAEEPPPNRHHWVEPNLEAWDRLLELVQITQRLPLLDEILQSKLNQMKSLVTLLRTCAQKRLRNQPLTKWELDELEGIGGWMDSLALSVAGEEGAASWQDIVHPADRKMACVADVHTTVDRRPGGVGEVVLEAAVGYAHAIYVLVPASKGRSVLTRGAVFSYYEFTQPLQRRLTDEQWQQMLEKGKAPAQPKWIAALQAKGLETVAPPL